MPIHKCSKTQLFNLYLPSTSEYLSARNTKLKMEGEIEDTISHSETEQLIGQALT